MRRITLSMLLAILFIGFGFSNKASSATNVAPSTKPATQTVLRYYIDKADYYLNDQIQNMDTVPLSKDDRTLL